MNDLDVKPINVYFVMILKLRIISFVQCVISEALWTDGHDWLHTNIRLKPFSQKVVVYGFVTDNSEYDFLMYETLLPPFVIYRIIAEFT